MRDVFMFDDAHGDAAQRLRRTLGGKGANLAEMTNVLRLPVPPGFTISASVGRAHLRSGWPVGLTDQITDAIGRLEAATGTRFGDPAEPLIVSVRSGAEVSMPGMLRSVLNVGVNAATVDGVAGGPGARVSGSERAAGRRFALDTYRRGITSLAAARAVGEPNRFDRILDDARSAERVQQIHQLSVDALETVVERSLGEFERVAGRPFPDDPQEHLLLAVESVLDSWSSAEATIYRRHDEIADDLGTAVNVQAMVFGNRNAESGSGVAFSRHPVTGATGVHGEFLATAQGDDVVAGTHDPVDIGEMAARWPAAFATLTQAARRLEIHYRDMVEIEFTVDDGTLWILQARVAKRSADAAARIAVALHDDPDIRLDRREAVARVLANDPDVPDDPETATRADPLLCTGIGASPGVATGAVYFTSGEAIDAADRGEAVILVRPDTSPADVAGLDAAVGVLTTTGGMSSHAAVVARGWSKPAVVGANALTISDNALSCGDTRVATGDTISIDGATGAVYLGAIATTPADTSPAMAQLRRWADDIDEA